MIRTYIEQELKSSLAAKNLLLLLKRNWNQLAVMPKNYQTMMWIRGIVKAFGK